VQIIPVFDIKEGILVHAVGGMRQNYLPLETSLIPGPEPERACATLVSLGFRRFYFADLDAITQSGNNFDRVRKLVGDYPIQVWLDAGLSGAEEIPLQDVSEVSLVAGSETLAGLSRLPVICRKIGPSRLVFSLDTSNGEVLTPDPTLKGIDPVDLAAEVWARGIEEMIVLDLKAVGSRSGLNQEFLHKLTRRIPGARFFPGGGLTPDDISELKRMNIPGVLTATALYSKQIAALPEL
jgi:phosphoribosylformimino-5-aminoimidazole carboxamide ribotide isomerase